MARKPADGASTATVGFEATLWFTADSRGEAEVAEGSAFLEGEASPQVVSKARDNFRKNDDVHWRLGVWLPLHYAKAV